MGVTNKRKASVCNQYRLYLNIIYHFGNKVMLLKQLYEYAQAFGIVKSESMYYGQIKELVNADILRQEPFIAFGKKTQLHMLTMRKYGIRFVQGKPDSQSVSAVPKSNTNERILVSIYKNAYILDKVIPRIKNFNVEPSFDMILKLLRGDRSTLLFNKNKGLDYFYTWDNAFIKKYFDVEMLRYDIDILEGLRNKKNAGLKKGSQASNGKGKGRTSVQVDNVLGAIEERYAVILKAENKRHHMESRKQKRLDKYNIDSMFSANAYISQIKPINGVLFITIFIFDINNAQDLYKIATQIASIYHMFFRYLKEKFKLKFAVITFDEEAQKNMKMEAQREVKDPFSKEPKGPRLKVTLKNWNISEDTQDKYIEIHFTNYNLTNRYLGGIKYSNLKRK